MFDSVYILAKGGLCVYSGSPIDLKQYLIESNTECTENQIPIEVIIKLSFEGSDDKNVRELCQKTSEQNEKLKSDVQDLLKLDRGLDSVLKVCKIIDFWYLLSRFWYRNYYSHWKSLLKTSIIFTSIYLMLILQLNKKVKSNTQTKSIYSANCCNFNFQFCSKF